MISPSREVFTRYVTCNGDHLTSHHFHSHLLWLGLPRHAGECCVVKYSEGAYSHDGSHDGRALGCTSIQRMHYASAIQVAAKAYIHACLRTHMVTYTACNIQYKRTQMHAHAHAHACIQLAARAHYIRAHMHMRAHVRTHNHMHTHMHTCTYVRIHPGGIQGLRSLQQCARPLGVQRVATQRRLDGCV